MISLSFLFFFAMLNQMVNVAGVDYCEKDCPGGKRHTICAKGCGEAGSCKAYRGDQQQFRQAMLDFHNEYRNKIATGTETRGGATAASNMKALSYDYELEKVAQCWMNKCIFEHDKCRWTAKYPYVGQNLYWKAIFRSKRSLGTKSELKKAVSDWYEEITDVPDNSPLPNFNTISGKGGKPIGHLTQLIWAESEAVGCARSEKSSGGKTEYFLACNYGPGGNMLGQKIYQTGDPCSNCGGGDKCNSKYSGLCGKDILPSSVPDDSYFFNSASILFISKYCIIAMTLMILLN